MLLLIAFSFDLYDMTQTTWLSFEFWSEGEKSKSVVMRNLGLLMVAIAGFFIAIFRGIVAVRNTQVAHRNSEIAEKTQVTTAFTAAIEQLGNDGLSIRLGGIYALGQIAQDHPEQYKSVVSNTLQAFIRSTSYHGKSHIENNNEAEAGWIAHQEAEQEKNAHLMHEEQEQHWQQDSQEQEYSNFLPNETGEDISAALMTIGQLKIQRAKLPNTFLVGADLRGCFLQGVNLKFAKLDNANLAMADLKYADLSNANLQGAFSLGANLKGSLFKGAKLDRADFRAVSGLTLAMIVSAKSWEGIELDDYLDKQLSDYMEKNNLN